MMKDKHLSQKIFHEAQQFHRLGDFAQALKLYKNLHDTFPKEVLFINLIAQVYIQIDQLGNAIEWLKKSIKLNQSQSEAYLNLGSIFFQIEDWNASLENFNKVIDLDKSNVTAYYNRGLVFKKLLRLDEALDDLNNALRVDKNNFEILNEIATTQFELFQYEEALKNYDLAIKLNTNFSPLFFNRSLTLDLLNRHEDALLDLDKAIQLNPCYFEALNFRAIILGKLNRYDEALNNFDQALLFNPNFVEAFYNKAWMLQKLKKFNDAIINYKKAITLNPQYAEAFNNLGTTFHEMKCYEDAIINYKKAITLNPQYAEAFNNLGTTFHEMKCYEDAIINYKKAITLNPQYAEACRNKAGTLTSLKRFEDAIFFYDKAIGLDPSMNEAYINKSLINLRLCNFSEGWSNYEYRRANPILKKSNNTQTYLLKDISELEKIFLIEEQGIGDKILYASLLHDLDNKNFDIFLETDERLMPIFKRSFKYIKICDKKNRPDTSLFKTSFGIGSLPSFLRKNIESFKNQKIRFLESDQEKKIKFRKILKNSSSKQICGLAWRSSNKQTGENKSIGLENFSTLSSLPNTLFVNLQYQVSDEEIKFLRDRCKIEIINFKDVDIFNDIDSLFSLVDACDFVLTSSNVTVHIAGSLGKKTYLVVPNENGKLWYWHEKHSRSIWYPNVQIFNQSNNDNWQKPITDICKKILKEI